MTFINLQKHALLAPECQSSAVIATASPSRIGHPLQWSISHRSASSALKLVWGLAAVFLIENRAAGMEESRGEMLYQNHCIACHTTQVHWRDQRLATDWGSLRGQVRRWERNTGLSWSDDDVEAVSEYLNRRYYDFPEKPRDRTISLLGSNDSTIKKPNNALARPVSFERTEK